MQKHQFCLEKRVQTFFRTFEKQNDAIKKIDTLLTEQIKELYDTMIKLKDYLIKKISSNKSQTLKQNKANEKPDDAKFAQKINNEEKDKKTYTLKEINSKLLSQMWNHSNNVQNHLNNKQMEQKIKSFIYPINFEIKKYCRQMIQNLDIQKKNKIMFYWNRKFLDNGYLIDKYRLSFKPSIQKLNRKSKSLRGRVLMSPNLTDVNQKIVSWRFKYINYSSSAYFGIIKRIIKQDLNKYLTVYGFGQNYVAKRIANDQKKLTQSQQMHFIQVRAGITICIQYNKQNNTLKFSNDQTKQTYTFKDIEPAKQREKYYIFANLSNPGDEIQFIPVTQ